MAERDTTMPAEGARWEFGADVAAAFDDMLARSIPQYDVMRAAVTALASGFVTPRTDVVDLGCSRGEAMAPLVDRFGAYNRFVGVEVSEPMLQAVRSRFAGMIECGVVTIRTDDLRTEYPPVRASVTLSVLTLQFTPLEYRQAIMARVYDHTLPGGAFILVEKVLGASARIDAIMVAEYLAMKRANGYSQEAIDRKRAALEGVLVPVTAEWNCELLRQAGFREVDCFWRWMDFAGFVAIRS